MSDAVRYHVFLSHATPDKPAVKEIARRLKAVGIEPWLDEWNLIPGDPWQPAIEEALRQCATCAVFVGPGEMGAWQNEEMRAAIDRRVRESAARAIGARPFRVIPVLLPSGQPPEYSRLPAFLQATTWVEFRDTLDDATAFHRLVCGIRGVEPGAAPGEAPLIGECPYRGLESFEEKHANLFFGRERMTQELVFKLRPSPSGQENRFLAILGASGSGKSSLAKAGLVPAVRRGEIAGSAQWAIIVFRPGRDPIESLAVALAGLDGSAPSTVAVHCLTGGLKAEENTLHIATRLALRDAPPERRAMLLVDQFEEVFTLCDHDPARQAFFSNLIYAATIAGGRTVVVPTMRADFYSKCGPYPALAAALSEHQFLVGPMTAIELGQAIERPARLAGGEFDPGLIEVLLREVVDRPAALPMLEFALTELWERRDGRRLTVAAYQAIGGLEGALSHRADEVFATFDDAERTLCRRIFLSLTRPGVGTEDTRRRATFAELVAAGADAEAVESVVNRLADARLVTTTAEPTNPRQRSLDVAHEALIRGWGKLRQWLDDDRAGHLIYLGLIDRAQEWDRSGRDPGLLDTGARLATAREWNESHPGELDPLGVDFLAAGLWADRQRKEAERAAALRVTTAEAEARREAAERTREAANARAAEERAKAEARHANTLRIAAQAALRQRDQFDLGLLLSVEAYRAEVTYETFSTLFASARSNPRLIRFQHGHKNHVQGVAFSPDGKTLASASIDRTVILWDVATGKPRGKPLSGHKNHVQGVAFSPDGQTLASASFDTTVILWDATTGKPRSEPLAGHKGGVTGVAYSPDGKAVASGSSDNTVILWDAATGKPRGAPLAGHKGAVTGVAYSPDGKILASASSDSTVILWDATTGKPRSAPLAGHGGSTVSSVAFSADSKTLASASHDDTLILWDATTGKPRGEPLTGHKDFVCAVEYSPDGASLASASWDNTVILWDVTTGKPLGEPLTGHKNCVTGVAFSPDGDTLASVSWDRTVILWDLTAGNLRGEPLAGHSNSVRGVAYSPDGKTVASVSWDRTVILWDATTSKPRGKPLIGHKGGVYGVAYSPDGKTIASASHDTTVILWDARTGKPRGEPLAGHAEAVTCVAFSPDGKTVASASEDKTVILWDATTGKRRGKPLAGHKGSVSSVAFSPDGKTLAYASEDKTVILWDTTMGRPRGEPLSGHEGKVTCVAFSPDGKTLASASWDKTVILWDAMTGKPRGEPLAGHSIPVTGVAFSPDGKTLASASWDNTVILWDPTTGKPLCEPMTGHEGWVTGVAYSPDGKTLASASEDKTVILWDLDPRSWERKALRRAGRNLSLAEWKKYIGPDTPYRLTSPEFPPGEGVIAADLAPADGSK